MKPPFGTPDACVTAHDMLVERYARQLGYTRRALLAEVCALIRDTSDIAPAPKLIELIALRDELQLLGSSSSSS